MKRKRELDLESETDEAKERKHAKLDIGAVRARLAPAPKTQKKSCLSRCIECVAGWFRSTPYIALKEGQNGAQEKQKLLVEVATVLNKNCGLHVVIIAIISEFLVDIAGSVTSYALREPATHLFSLSQDLLGFVTKTERERGATLERKMVLAKLQKEYGVLSDAGELDLSLVFHYPSSTVLDCKQVGTQLVFLLLCYDAPTTLILATADRVSKTWTDPVAVVMDLREDDDRREHYFGGFLMETEKNQEQAMYYVDESVWFVDFKTLRSFKAKVTRAPLLPSPPKRSFVFDRESNAVFSCWRLRDGDKFYMHVRRAQLHLHKREVEVVMEARHLLPGSLETTFKLTLMSMNRLVVLVVGLQFESFLLSLDRDTLNMTQPHVKMGFEREVPHVCALDGDKIAVDVRASQHLSIIE
jgi:hypothetical protein